MKRINDKDLNALANSIAICLAQCGYIGGVRLCQEGDRNTFALTGGNLGSGIDPISGLTGLSKRELWNAGRAFIETLHLSSTYARAAINRQDGIRERSIIENAKRVEVTHDNGHTLTTYYTYPDGSGHVDTCTYDSVTRNWVA